MFGESAGENVLDFFGENEVEIADAFHAVRDEIDYDSIPYVEPLGVMIHRFGDERDACHVTEGSKKILALVLTMEFAVLNLPLGQAGHKFGDFVVGEFARLHKGASGTLGLFIMVRARDGRNDSTAVENGERHGERQALRAMAESIILEDSFARKMRGVGSNRRSGER